MSKKTKYILVLIVGWSIAAGLIIIPRFIFKQPITPIATIATIATNATNADIVNAIYSLHDAIYSIQSNLQNTINTAMAIGIGIIIAVMVALK